MTAECVIVDSSVAYKWYDQREAGSAAALALLSAHRNESIQLVAPALLRIEVANSLRYAGLSAEALRDGVTELARFHLTLVDPDDECLVHACALALDQDMSVYDALFLALAVERGCPLVTADRKAFGKIPAAVCEVRFV